MPRSPVRVGPGKSYVDSLLGKAKTRTEALRLLRRRLSDRVYAALLADEKATSQPAYALAPTPSRVREEPDELKLATAARHSNVSASRRTHMLRHTYTTSALRRGSRSPLLI